MSRHTAAIISVCSAPAPHDAHLIYRDPEMAWCLGAYDQERQNRRVVVAGDPQAGAHLVGEGLTVVGSAHRLQREPHPVSMGGCGECRQPEDFAWDPVRWEDDAPVITCHVHGALAPGWAYDDDIEVGLLAYRNAEVLAG